MKDKKWYESKKWICWLIFCLFAFGLAFFLAWMGLGWQAVAVAALATVVSAALIVSQAFVDRVLARVVEGISALKKKEEDE